MSCGIASVIRWERRTTAGDVPRVPVDQVGRSAGRGNELDPYRGLLLALSAFPEKSLHFAKVRTVMLPMIRGIPEGGPVAVYRAGEAHRAGCRGPRRGRARK
jgi:hypothetical protein